MHNNKESLISKISNEFINLLNLEIFDKTVFLNLNLWKKFAFWAYFSVSSDLKKQFYDHCNLL